MFNAVVRLIASLSCISIMIGFYYACKWFMHTVSIEYGFGFICGMYFIMTLFYFVHRVDPTCFDRKTPRLKWWHL